MLFFFPVLLTLIRLCFLIDLYSSVINHIILCVAKIALMINKSRQFKRKHFFIKHIGQKFHQFSRLPCLLKHIQDTVYLSQQRVFSNALQLIAASPIFLQQKLPYLPLSVVFSSKILLIFKSITFFTRTLHVN